jgi:hypothetical protein
MKVEDLFSDILYTSENPAVIKTEKVFKEGDKIKRISKEDKYNLIQNDILSELRTCQSIDIDFYQRGILKIFRKYKKSEITEILKDILISDYKFVITNEKTSIKLSSIELKSNNLQIFNELNDDEIIIGDKIANCILSTKNGEYYFDKSQVQILYLR